MNREELKLILPHREPMLLVDDAEKCGENKSVGHYTVRGDEYFLKGHFPDNPVVPGVILCEMASQSACVILADKVAGKTTLFAGMNNVKFKKPVRAGDAVVFECELLRSLANFYFIKAVGKVEGKIAVSGEFSFCLVDSQ
ncbi:MAG: 3-hydroxyacyl-ACP dehydratase FabZ family protein [Candidatus Coproplasma sp.]